MRKHRLQDMSWMEAEEAFKRADTVIVPVGTLHAHGPIPIGIDARSVEKLADEVGRRTGLMVLPVLAYGENDKMKHYPGTITIDQHLIEAVYTAVTAATTTPCFGPAGRHGASACWSPSWNGAASRRLSCHSCSRKAISRRSLALPSWRSPSPSTGRRSRT
ncbi:MAG: creatininase family protein [Bacillati bacterium ANGP1]|uniref:Creatininase family protein n=1 Tax=Candidatus Segetimicrobium genomatis TaxID=2569760 RepID=A0A537LXT6_9BACT|nr:MAG: creatininase family protein [Terrabacteria group bacterium ANGP1]